MSVKNNGGPDSDQPAKPPPSVNWRQEYMYLSVGLMTASWLAGWMVLTLNWFIAIPISTVFGLCVFHIVAGIVLTRWMIRHGRSGLLQSTVSFVLMWLAAGLTAMIIPTIATPNGTSEPLALRDLFSVDQDGHIPIGPIVIIWSLFLWWRGVGIGNAYLGLVRTTFNMRLGILGLLWLILVAGASLRPQILALAPPFFFFGLLSTSLARTDSLNLDRAKARSLFGRGWIISLLTFNLAITTGGYAFAIWLAGIDLGRANSAFVTLSEGILALLFIIFTPVLFLGQVLYNTLKTFLPNEMPGTTIDTSSSTRGDGSSIQLPWFTDIVAILGDAMIIVTLAFLALLAIAFLWFVFFARASRSHQDDEHESLGTTEIVGSLRHAMRDNWRQLTAALGMLRNWGIGRDFFAVLTIRRIYARMEKLASERGYPRSEAQTPYEYQQALVMAFPGLSNEIKHITEVYILVRYGELPEDPDELQNVRVAWESLRTSADPSKPTSFPSTRQDD